MIASETFLNAFLALPEGTFIGHTNGRRYVVSRTVFGAGKSHKLVAHELGGPGYISMNLYLTQHSGALLRPCEMPAEKVVLFVTNLIPDTDI
ncbi:hypothetical protein RUE5091_02112 [Ruegeria denitrificans]|uniref:Uncharacterized protein n=1 Tax=Ruegeria denitrificans TaxID=1715692 RepID=A0A0P1I9W8_9RHOB|nr:hypothetical protein [Ruegeria denitrificans]CUK00294.1 hypothetical protein RUE5091_02112 [Ruegeria denitrificans]